MKKLFLIISMLAGKHAALHAQTALHNQGATITITTGAAVYVQGNLYNAVAGNLKNDGTLIVKKDLINNQVMNSANAGTLELSGNSAQSIGGTSPFFANNVVFNNSSSGVTLNSRLKINGLCTFANGLIHAPDAGFPLHFTNTGTYASAYDNSHVVGYVLKEGTGNFVYPVGDGTRYQKAGADLTANTNGFLVRYYPADAGSGTYLPTGTENTLLTNYNTSEYWDMSPLGTATGTVTMYWDAYKNTGITNISHLKVAHKLGGNWLNEGTTATGIINTGSVTSNILTAWSPFTLGSTNSLSPLPVNWLSFSGHVNAAEKAMLYWKVSENNVADYQVQKSNDGINFFTIASVNSMGDGTNNYAFTETTALNSLSFFRIKQTDKTGRFTYSSIIRLYAGSNKNQLMAYPTPFTNGFTVSVNAAQVITLTNVQGQVVKRVKVDAGSTYMAAMELSSGIYFLSGADGSFVKMVKQQ